MQREIVLFFLLFFTEVSFFATGSYNNKLSFIYSSSNQLTIYFRFHNRLATHLLAVNLDLYVSRTFWKWIPKNYEGIARGAHAYSKNYETNRLIFII